MSEAATAEGPRVLVVEDDRDLRGMLIEIFEGEGY